MSEEYVLVPADQMRQIARYEITFDKIIEIAEIENGKLIFPENYAVTLEDLREALKNIISANPTVGEFGDNWYYPLTTLDENFGLREACMDEEEPETVPGSVGTGVWSRLPLTSGAVFSRVWYGLEDIWTENDDDERVGEFEEIGEYISDIDRFLANRGKPVVEMEFSEYEKEDFIEQFNDDDIVRTADDEALAICRRFTEELADKDSPSALRLKGYACYGGNRLYDCDWKVSRDCMIRLYDKTGDPQFANTLGYIYYYGRCTGGVPEYEKAFEMFAVSAANGLHEGMYKIADMFLHGYACKKSESAARFLYERVYEDCLRQFVKGREGAFADAALRMGNVYLKGIGVEKDPAEAYCYFLQADFAAKRRAKENDFFGYANVVVSIANALDSAREEIADRYGEYFSDHLDLELPGILFHTVDDGYRGQLDFEIREDSTANLTVRRCPKRGEEKPEPMLITYPQLDFCELSDSSEMEIFDLMTSGGDRGKISFRYDSLEWNHTENRLDIYYDTDLAGWISYDKIRINKAKKEKPSGKLLTLASISFQPNGRTYDYLCEIPGIQPGDRVIVNGYDGETEVTVRRVYTRYESELGLPLDRYKKVIRKCE
ncbi:MAG: sel1 repeat family protein [Clostridia bacterium]|nr:sel1 repeat family protein [Clostridia bacterium]